MAMWPPALPRSYRRILIYLAVVATLSLLLQALAILVH